MICVHHRSCRQRNHSSSEVRAPNMHSACANKAFKVIVSCLMCDDRTSFDWDHLFKNGLSAVIKLPGVMTPFFILSLSCPECGCDSSCSYTVGTESIHTPLNFSLFVILQPFAKII